MRHVTTTEYGTEVALSVAGTGMQLVADGEDLHASRYVRVCDPEGFELAYWNEDEWREEPGHVMGAIVGALCVRQTGDPARAPSIGPAMHVLVGRADLVALLDYMQADEEHDFAMNDEAGDFHIVHAIHRLRASAGFSVVVEEKPQPVYVLDARGYDEPELFQFPDEEAAIEFCRRTGRMNDEDGIEPDVRVLGLSEVTAP